jgi:CHAD domain-containing protein
MEMIISSGNIRATVEKLETTLHKSDATVAEKVHRLRLTTKRLRSVWRLLKRESGRRVYRTETARLRQVARSVSAKRDHDVISQLVKRLKVNNRDRKVSAEFNRVEREMIARGGEQSPPPPWEKLAREIQISADNLEAMRCEREHLERQFQRSVKRVEKMRRQCMRKTAEAEDFHCWRRQTKYLIYQMEFLNSLGLKVGTEELRDELKSLAADLGQAHDHQMLCDFMKKKNISQKALHKALMKKHQFERKSRLDGLRLDFH